MGGVVRTRQSEGRGGMKETHIVSVQSQSVKLGDWADIARIDSGLFVKEYPFDTKEDAVGFAIDRLNRGFLVGYYRKEN